MITPSAYLVHRKSDSDEVVLLCDFSAAGRPSATFTDLASALRTGHNVWETAPPPYGTEGGLTGQDQVERWVAEIAEFGIPVRGVIGYCAGTVYAAAIAARLAQWQPAPALILLDPNLPARHMMLDDFERMISVRLAPVLSSVEVADAVEAGRAAYARTAGELTLAEDLAAICHRVMTPAFLRSGLDAQRSVEMPELFTSYLYWLAGAIQLDPRPQWINAPALRSANTPGWTRQLSALLGSEQQLEVPHGEMLRSAEVAAAVDRLLSGPVAELRR